MTHSPASTLSPDLFGKNPQTAATLPVLGPRAHGASLQNTPAARSQSSLQIGAAWSLPAAEPLRRQPQDGAPASRRVAPMRNTAVKAYGNVLQEPEDARLTGGTRSLMRRLMGLNAPKTEPRTNKVARSSRVAASLPAGQPSKNVA